MGVLEYADELQRESLKRMPLAWGDEEEDNLYSDATMESARQILNQVSVPPSMRKKQLWFAQDILKDVRQHADERALALLAHTPVVEIMMADLNAHAVRDPESGETLIVYNMHTPGFFYIFNLLVASDDVFPADMTDRARSDFASMALRVAIKWARAASRTLALTDRSDNRLPSLLNGYVERVSPVVHMQCAFILAHEVGHHVLGHLDDSSVFMSAAASDSEHVVRYLTHAQEQELEADSYACAVLRSMQKELQGDWSSVGTFAADTLFTWFQLIEALEPSNRDSRPPSHPNALVRRQNVRRIMPRGSESRVAEVAENLVMMVCDKIKEKGNPA